MGGGYKGPSSREGVPARRTAKAQCASWNLRTLTRTNVWTTGRRQLLWPACCLISGCYPLSSQRCYRLSRVSRGRRRRDRRAGIVRSPSKTSETGKRVGKQSWRGMLWERMSGELADARGVFWSRAAEPRSAFPAGRLLDRRRARSGLLVLLGSRVTGALRYAAAFAAGRRRRTRSKLAQGSRSLARVSASFARGQA